MKIAMTLLSGVLAWAAFGAAESQSDPLTADRIDPKRWNVGKMGTVKPGPDGVYLSGGAGENAASLVWKQKVSPDQPYDFVMEFCPLAAENQGYAVLVGGPGWYVASRGDGGFWLQCDAAVVGNVDPQPMDAWYRVEAKNRRGVVQVALSTADGRELGRWTAVKNAGLEGAAGATALVGTNRPGPRGMKVRNAALTLIDESNDLLYPEDDTEWLDAAHWRVDGAGEVVNASDGSLKAEVRSGSLVFRLPTALPFDQVVEVCCAMSITTADESYNLSYQLLGDGPGFVYLNDLNRSGSAPFQEVIVNAELSPVFGGATGTELLEFRIAPTFLDAPYSITVERLQFSCRE